MTDRVQELPVNVDVLFGAVCGKTDKKTLNIIRERWEGIDDYIFNLVLFLNNLGSLVEDGLLIQNCVDTGVQYWAGLNHELCSDVHRVAAFIKGTLFNIPDVLGWRVIWPEVTRVSSVQWDPYEESLTKTWQEQAREAERFKREQRPKEVADPHFRSIILTKHLIKDPTLMASMAPEFDYILGE